MITFSWSASDTQTAVTRAHLYKQGIDGSWTPVVDQSASGAAGVFTATLTASCIERYAILATDAAGNEREPRGGSEEVTLYPLQCQTLPYAFGAGPGS
jgi:hypothetical protein